jgi:hypothetical protein
MALTTANKYKIVRLLGLYLSSVVQNDLKGDVQYWQMLFVSFTMVCM